MNFSLIWAGLADPSKMFSMALSLIASPEPTICSEASFYPPLDLISYITDAGYGTFGSKYIAPAESESAFSDSFYNYCTMPHPDPQHYELPSPV